MHAAIFQCDGSQLTPDQRLAKLATVVQQHTFDLIVCPELFLSGYNVGDELYEYAEPCDGAMAKKIAQLARTTRTAIVYGFPEPDGDLLYNSASCFSASGELLATHRKLCLPPGFEVDYFQPGKGVTIFELSGLRCGLLICYDAEFPESVRALAVQGVQLVIVPTALGAQWGNVSKQLMPTRAFENGVWLMYANHAGSENGAHYFGGSCIAAPNGSDAARADENEKVISATIDEHAVAEAQARLQYLTNSDVLKKRLYETGKKEGHPSR